MKKKTKKQLEKELQQEIESIKDKLSESLKYIEENAKYLDVDSWEVYELQSILNSGSLLVKTKSLADYYAVDAFCTNNNLQFESFSF